jgi:hypothetical protein
MVSRGRALFRARRAEETMGTIRRAIVSSLAADATFRQAAFTMITIRTDQFGLCFETPLRLSLMSRAKRGVSKERRRGSSA